MPLTWWPCEAEDCENNTGAEHEAFCDVHREVSRLKAALSIATGALEIMSYDQKFAADALAEIEKKLSR